MTNIDLDDFGLEESDDQSDNEDKVYADKYKSVDELEKGAIAGQQFIDTLKEEGSAKDKQIAELTAKIDKIMPKGDDQSQDFKDELARRMAANPIDGLTWGMDVYQQRMVDMQKEVVEDYKFTKDNPSWIDVKDRMDELSSQVRNGELSGKQAIYQIAKLEKDLESMKGKVPKEGVKIQADEVVVEPAKGAPIVKKIDDLTAEEMGKELERRFREDGHKAIFK